MAAASDAATRLERAAPEEIAGFQTAKLRRLLRLAATTSYYGSILRECGIDPATATIADLVRVPLLEKKQIQQQGEALRIPSAAGVIENHTGGSTGEPIRFWQDLECRVQMSAATLAANQRAGVFPGCRVAKLWGAPQDRRKIEGPLGAVRLWALNMRYYDTFDMGEDRLEAYHESLEAFQPDVIQAYASSAHLLACFLKRKGIRPGYPRVSVISSAERLYPHMRSTIEEVFRVKVYDRYGSREASAIASECPAGQGLHVFMPSYIVELVDPETGKPVAEGTGEIALTCLDNLAMPMIRYRIGDTAEWAEGGCACGSSFRRLKRIAGRTTDSFRMAGGRIIHGEYFTHLFYGAAGVAQFQFVQESLDRFVLRLTPGDGYHSGTAARIGEEIRRVIGPESRLEIELHEKIPVTASGKFRFTVSHLDKDTCSARRECA
jgi:phenylacetate-CoA ligase